MSNPFNTSLIDSYLLDFQEQILNTTKDYYVIYKLDNPNNVNELSKLLENPYIVNYIINITYQQPFYIDINKESNPYTRENGLFIVPKKTWFLMITGFKYGARKNSPRRLGLVAYDPYYNNPPNFVTNIFYNSFLFDDLMYYNLGFHINNIIITENYYLQNNNNEYVPFNYIKEVTPKKKSSKKKTSKK